VAELSSVIDYLAARPALIVMLSLATTVAMVLANRVLTPAGTGTGDGTNSA
jgi:hypothetical protein